MQKDSHVIFGESCYCIVRMISSCPRVHPHPFAFPASNKPASILLIYLRGQSHYLERGGGVSLSAAFEFVWVYSILFCICVQQNKLVYENYECCRNFKPVGTLKRIRL